MCKCETKWHFPYILELSLYCTTYLEIPYKLFIYPPALQHSTFYKTAVSPKCLK